MAIQRKLGVEIRDRIIVMIGAGGASRAACVQCLEEGCSELWIGNRSAERLDALLTRLRHYYPDRNIRGFQLGNGYPEINKDAGAILINATSVGLRAGDSIPVDLDTLGKVSFVYDMVYGRHTTALLREADRLGLPASDGLPMLIYQGERSLQIWTEKPVPVDVMTAAVDAHMASY